MQEIKGATGGAKRPKTLSHYLKAAKSVQNQVFVEILRGQSFPACKVQ
jgi:hypothetical protein